MHVAFSANDSYTQHLAVAMASLLKNLSPGITPSFYVITKDITQKSRDKIETLKSIRDFTIRYLHVREEDFADYPIVAHLTIETYFRLRLPALLPDLDRVIYLDSDLVVTGDLNALWRETLPPGTLIGAVHDFGIGGDFAATLGMNRNSYYFNAGVLLIDLDAWRKADLDPQFLSFARDYRDAIRFGDQDVLNHVCEGRISWLHPQYNIVSNMVDKSNRLDRFVSPYPLADLQAALAKPVIVHFTGAVKPWHYACRNRFAPLYIEYLRMTPWAGYRYPDKTWKNRVAKTLYRLRRAMK